MLWLSFVYHCFDRIVIYGYLSGLSRPERVVNFFRLVVGVPVVSKEVLSQRTADYQNWVEALFALGDRLRRCSPRHLDYGCCQSVSAPIGSLGLLTE
jgi:hypothetical protein